METASTAGESTSLLRNTTTSIDHRHLLEIPATFNDLTPLDGNDITSGEQTPQGGSCASFNEETPPFGEGTSNSDRRPLVVSCPGIFERKANEVSVEEVAQVMCSAYQRHHRRANFVGLDIFTTKQLYAMHLAWKSVTRGRHCSSQPHIIAEAVAQAINVFLSGPLYEGNLNHPNEYFYLEFTKEKSLLIVNLLREWERIIKGVGFPARYTETIFEDSEERPPAVSEFRLRQVELYDKVNEFFRRPRLEILSLLIVWPISLLIVGSKYAECLTSPHLSYMFIILGYVGCLAIIARLSLLYLTSETQYAYDLFWEWICLRLVEFTFFVAFIAQAFYFFDADPTTEPDPNQCMQNFYSVALVINYVSIALVSACVFGYSVVICKNLFDFWHWIFRYF